MNALPAIRSAATIAVAGGDFRPFLRARDPVERLAEVAVFTQAAERRASEREVERKNLAIEVGNNVGQIVGRALSETLRSLARAMRPNG